MYKNGFSLTRVLFLYTIINLASWDLKFLFRRHHRKKEIWNFIFEKQSSIWNQDKGTIMAGLLSKNKELLRLIPDLQCHDCKSVPGPNENQKNRYSCFDASHILCEEHKAKCPCGSKVKNFIKPARLFWTGPNHFVQVHIKFSRLIFM